MEIWLPFAIRYFDGDKTSEALLLAGSVESREFAAHCDNWRGDWISQACSRTVKVAFHRVDIIVVPPTRIMVSIRVVCR